MKKDIPKVYRHGEVHFVFINSLPEGLTKAKTDVIMNGSGGNDHIIKNADIFFKEENNFIFGYLHAKKGNKLLHVEHGKTVKGSRMKECSLPEGYYQLRRQVEYTNEGMKPVID